MTDTPAPTEARYPSRRTLRQGAAAAEAQEATPPGVGPSVTEDPVPDAALSEAVALSAAVHDAERAVSPAEPAGSPAGQASPRSGAPRTDSIRVPRRAHVPADVAPHRSGPAARVPLRRRLAGVAAGASVCGLVLALALPLTENAGFAEPVAAAEQRLFSEVSVDSIPASLSDITAVATDDGGPASFATAPEMVVNYPFAEQVQLTDGFGYRTAPVAQFHDAQDFAAPAGTQILAIADGIVLEAGYASDGCGFGLKLEHEIDGQEVTSRYCHMQDGSHSYEVGDEVRMGDPAGRVGNTGMSFGPHLHLAIRVDDEPVDPMPFLAKYSHTKRGQELTPAAG